MGASSEWAAENEEMRRDVEDVVNLACSDNPRPLNDAQKALLRWACGIGEKTGKQRWAEMAVAGD